jgi:hypothetical protein
MPQSHRRKVSTGTAILWLTAAWVAGCVPIDESKTEAAAAPGAAVSAEALPGPVALAPEVTGAPPAKPAAAATAEKIAAVLAAPKPVPAPEATAATATPAAAEASPAPPPVRCPPDTVGKWIGPDVVGAPVYICRRLTSG